MPSPESQKFLTFFGLMLQKVHDQPEFWASAEAGALLYESVHILATEPEAVTYRTVQCPGTVRPALWCIPEGASKDTVILFFHGGGFTSGSPYSHRKMVAHIAKAAEATALLVDYSKLPTYTYPSAHNDSVSTYRWLIEIEGFSPGRVAAMGDLAGAQLAMTLPHNARAAGLRPPGAIVGISPWLDLETRNEGLEIFREWDPTVNGNHLKKSVQSYYVDAGVNLQDPSINVLYDDLKQYPPAYLCWGTNEALQDNGAEFAELATVAGASIETEIVSGMYHCYTFMAGNAPEADQTIAKIGVFLKQHLV